MITPIQASRHANDLDYYWLCPFTSWILVVELLKTWLDVTVYRLDGLDPSAIWAWSFWRRGRLECCVPSISGSFRGLFANTEISTRCLCLLHFLYSCISLLSISYWDNCWCKRLIMSIWIQFLSPALNERWHEFKGRLKSDSFPPENSVWLPSCEPIFSFKLQQSSCWSYIERGLWV